MLLRVCWWIKAALTDDLRQRVAAAVGAERGFVPPPLTPFNPDTQTRTRAVNTFTHTQPMFLTLCSLILLRLLLRSDLRGWNWTSLGRSLADRDVFCVCFLLLFCCVFLFVCFLILFFAAPAVRTPRRVGRRWAPCQEMMSWPASPLTLVCVFDTPVLFRCDCAVPDATARVCMCACGLHLWRVCVCGRILHSVCVHEEIVPQQL